MANILDLGLWETRSMYNALIKRQPAPSFLLDMFAPGPGNFSFTETIQFDVVREGLVMAPFVSPLHQGHMMEKPSKETRVISPAYLKPKMYSHAAEFLNRFPGENFMSNVPLAMHAADQNAMDLDTLRTYCLRRFEWMLAKQLTEFTFAVTGDGVGYTVDLSPTTGHKLEASDLSASWGTTSNKTADLELAQATIAKDSSLTADIAIFGKTAWSWFANDSDAMGKLDNLNYSVGQIIRDGVKSGANFHGTYNGLQLWTYLAWYKDPADNTVKPFIPDDYVVVGSTAARVVKHYAQIVDLDVPNGFREPIFPKVWKDNDPSGINLLLQMRGMPAIHDVDGFVRMDVITD